MAEIGSVLGGRYRLIELLGQGGMATIYRATDAQLGRDVAVKLLRPEYGRDPDFVARFELEARSVASLSSPNVVAVHDFGTDPAGPYIVMDLVDGEDLATLLRRNGALPARKAARIAADVGRAIAAAHARGIVHRDIKPGNILIAQDGRVQVADFGIARALAEAQMTLPGTTLGSIHYMSPEQARGELATERSDIYSLGVVLFEMLAGRRPFEGDSAGSVAMARLTPPVPVVSQFRAGVPADFESICVKAMAIDPADRFPTATAMAGALDDALAGRPSVAPSLPGARVPAAGAALAAGGLAGAAVAGSVGPSVVASARAGAGIGAGGAARPRPPAAIPYAPDSFAGSGVGGDDDDGGGDDDDRDEPSGPGPWPWIAGLLGLAVLVLAGFLIYKLATGGPNPATLNQVNVPNFVGKTLAEAKPLADANGLVLKPTQYVKSNDQAEGTITFQSPALGSRVDRGSTIGVTVVTGQDVVQVPPLRNLPELIARQAIIDAGLVPGARSEAFDAIVSLGNIVNSTPPEGAQAKKGTPVDYIVSKGPEPTPTPPPTPSPTPVPTPSPSTTPSPTAVPLSPVGEYRCVSLGQAKVHITADGFVLGAITAQPTGYVADDSALVIQQSPLPGQERPAGSAIDLTVYDQATSPYTICPSGP